MRKEFQKEKFGLFLFLLLDIAGVNFLANGIILHQQDNKDV